MKGTKFGSMLLLVAVVAALLLPAPALAQDRMPRREQTESRDLSKCESRYAAYDSYCGHKYDYTPGPEEREWLENGPVFQRRDKYPPGVLPPGSPDERNRNGRYQRSRR